MEPAALISVVAVNVALTNPSAVGMMTLHNAATDISPPAVKDSDVCNPAEPHSMLLAAN